MLNEIEIGDKIVITDWDKTKLTAEFNGKVVKVIGITSDRYFFSGEEANKIDQGFNKKAKFFVLKSSCKRYDRSLSIKQKLNLIDKICKQ
mgnify:CR=1 FL=1